MRVLRRDTLEWENVKIKGKKINYYLNDYDFRNILAFEGKISTKGLGYCSDCQKIMTKKEYEKHLDYHVSGSRCIGCYWYKNTDMKFVKQNGKFAMKSVPYCRQLHCNITPDTECKYGRCSGGFCTNIAILTPKIPKKILTIKVFLDNPTWHLDYLRSDQTRFRYSNKNIYATCDANGYLVSFQCKGLTCWFDENRGRLIDTSGYSLTVAETKLNVFRRLYENN